VDAEYPQFTQHLLEMVYPDYLAPSLGIVRLQPDMSQGSLADGIPVPHGPRLKSGLGHDVQTPCQYQTAHALKLWPIAVAEARYMSSMGEVAQLGVPQLSRARSALRLTLRLTIGEQFSRLPLESLTFYLRGGDQVAIRLYEQLFCNALQVVVQGTEGGGVRRILSAADAIRPLGFEDDEALFPPSPRSFQGYRLLREYFAFSERFMFVTVTGLGPAVRGCASTELEILVIRPQLRLAGGGGRSVTVRALLHARDQPVSAASRPHPPDRLGERASPRTRPEPSSRFRGVRHFRGPRILGGIGRRADVPAFLRLQ
jgi:type VI secretion system protein ImpG